MKVILGWLVAVGLALAMTGCTSGGGDRSGSTPSAPASGPTAGSLPAFQEFSGLTLPASATGVAVQLTSGPDGRPAYKVVLNLPSSEVDAFCTDGGLDRPLRVTTIPQSFREAFDYRGDSTTGVSVAQGSLPSNLGVQREVLAVGTKKTVAEVRVYAYTIGG